MVRKDAWYDFNFLKFTEAWFVTQDVIYPGECSVCTWEESVFCDFWVECSINIKSVWSVVSFKACVSLFIFCLDDLSIGVSGVLKSPTIIVLLSISPFKSKYGASLVAQWLRICLLMQGTRVRALVWEDPTCRRATGPVSHNCWACASGACAPQWERPR